MKIFKYEIMFLLCLLSLMHNKIYADDNPFKIAYSVQSYYNVNTSFHKSDTIDVSNISDIVNGFSIDCKIIRFSDNSFVRILLEDTIGHNFLVLENDKYRNNSDTIIYAGYCEETASLNCISPKYLKIYIKDANITINKINYSPITSNFSVDYATDLINADTIKKKQIRQIVNNINKYNSEHNKLWSAGVTNVSLMNYETKKRALGIQDDACDTNGFEYYIGGLYEVGEENDTIESTTSDSVDFATSYVESFDWRNRHGKNWMTSCKSQGSSKYCNAFAINGVLEALVNLYYNKKIDIDLSEQDIIYTYARSWNKTSVDYFYSKGINETLALQEIKSFGVIDESSAPFIDSPNVLVPPKRNDSVECLSFKSKQDIFYHTNNINGIKSALIRNGPLFSGIQANEINHAMTLVGYHTIKAGDTISHITTEYNGAGIIPEGDRRIGKTYWVFKNSYGEDFGRNGYMYVLFNNYTSMVAPTYIKTPLYSLLYSDDDIVCSDNDGDGYYFWGIGDTRPSSLPEWAPKVADGDDSNAKYGPSNYGSLQEINPNKKDTIFITEETKWEKDNYIWQHVVIKNGGILNITSNIKFYKGVNILVENGGKLNVSGGYLEHPNIEVQSNGELHINDKGKIKKNKHFSVSNGAKMRIGNGIVN